MATQGTEALLALAAGWRQNDKGEWTRKGCPTFNTPREALRYDRRAA